MFKRLQPLKQEPKHEVFTDSDLYCPKCGSPLIQNSHTYYCTDWDSQGGCGYKIKKSRVM